LKGKNKNVRTAFSFIFQTRTMLPLRKLLLSIVLFIFIALPSLVVLHLCFPLEINIPYSTIIEDKDGNVIHAFLTDDDKWRMKSEPSEISPLLKKTLIYKEDKYFYYHFGINPIAMARAMVMNTIRQKRTSGASTITMQVARMLQPKDRTYLNKVVEMFRALQLEWMFTKNEILELYFNLVPFGSNIEGIKSASILYLKKEPDFLSLAEATALSIVPNRPSSLKPGLNNDLIVQERNKWLARFRKDKLFPEQEIADALNEPFKVERYPVPRFAPHFAQRMKTEARNDIVKTTLDMKVQSSVEQLAGDYVKSIYALGIKNASVLVIENKTHKAVAYIGSADFFNKEDGGQVDGVRAVRQPGSALKPLLYAICIDEGLITPKSVITDVELDIAGYRPENYDEKFNGYVTVEYALMNSLNVPAVKMLNELGEEKMIAKLEECNFNQIKKDKAKLGLSLILGGCGVKLEEMTALFSMLANEGDYHRPLFLQGDTLHESKPVLSASAAFMVTEMLSKIQRPDMPSAWEAGRNVPRIAWKTGTSYGRRDAWSIGYNSKYTVGVWVGNFSGIGSPELNGAHTATPLLFRIFNTIDQNSSNDWRDMRFECGMRLVCSETGKTPNDFCTSTVMDYFIPLVSSNQPCDNMREVAVSADESISYCSNCQPDAGYKKKLYKVVPPEMQTFFEQNKIAYTRIPVHNPDCDKVFEEGKPQITSPVNRLEYLIDKNSPEPIQLSCDVTNDVSKVHWYINNKFLQSATAKEKIFFTPDEGKIKISCTDDKGRNTDVWITVRYVKI